MFYHKVSASACQSHSPTADTVPPAPSGLLGQSLAQRYGPSLLTGGYTAIPTYAWVYIARLGVSEAEMVCIAQLCTYWWTTHNPYPGERALAVRMGKTVRTIQSYLRSLEAKGFLRVLPQFSDLGQQVTNSYDIHPFFIAIEGLARLDGLLPETGGSVGAVVPAIHPHLMRDRSGLQEDNSGPVSSACDPIRSTETLPRQQETQATSMATVERQSQPVAGATTMPPVDEELRLGRVQDLAPQVDQVELDTFDFNSIRPVATPMRTCVSASAAPDGKKHETIPGSIKEAGDGALAAIIATLSAELGDDSPLSSITRARNLRCGAGDSKERFLALVETAAIRTRERQDNIYNRRRDGHTVNAMPYLFAVLTDLLHIAPIGHLDRHPDAQQRTTVIGGRRRPQLDDSQETQIANRAACTDRATPLPITEQHPVWRAALSELVQIMTCENFNAWLATTRVLSQDGELLRVAVPTVFVKTWLEHRLANRVTGVLRQLHDTASDVHRVEYVVDPAMRAPGNVITRAS